MKQSPFNYKKLELCHNCNGFGTIDSQGKTETCPVCNGTGRIIKITQGTVTIEAFNNDSSHRF